MEVERAAEIDFMLMDNRPVNQLSISVEVKEMKYSTLTGSKVISYLNQQGDLIVTGNVNDYFDLKARNNVKVGGSIANAKVSTGGNLNLKVNKLGELEVADKVPNIKEIIS